MRIQFPANAQICRKLIKCGLIKCGLILPFAIQYEQFYWQKTYIELNRKVGICLSVSDNHLIN